MSEEELMYEREEREYMLEKELDLEYQKQKQELIDYLKEQINECLSTGNDEDYIKLDIYREILDKIEKSDD